MPRFQPENFETNVKLVKGLEKVSQKKHCTPAQLALAWIRTLSNKQGMPKFIQIPGATTTDRAKDNAVEVELTEGELKDIDTILRNYEIFREMYALSGVATINDYSFSSRYILFWKGQLAVLQRGSGLNE